MICYRKLKNFHNRLKVTLIFASLILLVAYFQLKDGPILKGKARSPFFHKFHKYDCSDLFLEEPKLGWPPMPYPGRTDLELYNWLENCSNIHEYFYWPNSPFTSEEAEFPLAFSIQTNADFDHVLRLIHATYAPQNAYCIHIDLKAPHLTFEVINRFIKCLGRDNIRITSRLETVFWDGYPILQATLNCLKDLDALETPWRYVFTLQGRDFPLRSNIEYVRIMKLYAGGNDIELLPKIESRYAFPRKFKFNEEGLPYALEDMPQIQKEPPPVPMYKGSSAAALSRDFVHFLFTNPVSLKLQAWLNDTALPDEYLYSTIVHNELGTPGYYPGRCLDAHNKDWITRYALWSGIEPEGIRCRTLWRHGVCLFGTKDLALIRKQKQLFVNKFWIRKDAIGLYCMHELIFNRTYGFRGRYQIQPQLDIEWYANLSVPRYQKWIYHERKDSDFVC